MKFIDTLTRGIIKENPIFRLVLGMCPTLAVTTSLENSLGMGVAATFVLICSNAVIALLRKLIPAKVRIPCYIVVIATFVTIVDLVMNAYAPALHASLGLFIPLIVVNCIILGRAEAFASKNPVLLSIADGVGMGLGFTLGLAVLGICREVLGAGSITLWTVAAGPIGWQIPWYKDTAMVMLVLAPGGFIMLGSLLALMNHLQACAAQRRGQAIPLPVTLDCRHCTLCKWGA
jgi:Na+-translocating ferredoxin:NAD+ oxidoreductase subunit E